ncbi:MAG: PHP domain-containing protein [Oscillospiraceae bacterium]|nr:PHP domain-containing protein [Oscillospiraceae bacterium]
MNVFYDLHLHSCLSPCADDDMTPGNLCGMAKLAGLQAIALTDHNTCGNVRVFCSYAKRLGLVGVPGMELTTREEIHVVCLFPSCEDAERFGDYAYGKLPDIPNNTEVFGNQILTGIEDEPRGVEPRLLFGAADIGIYEVAPLVQAYNGVAFPAHIDRGAFSLLAILGLYDPSLGFSFTERPGVGLPHIENSDAHWLGGIPDAANCLNIPALTAQGVIDGLKAL